jgi:Family of unknown function (DUF5681)
MNNKDYGVGYRKPPMHTRFRPGVSGNPRGRPKGSISIRDLILKIFGKKIRLHSNGTTRSMSFGEALLTKIAMNGLNGDVQAGKLLLQLLKTTLDEIAEKETKKPMVLVLSKEDMNL